MKQIYLIFILLAVPLAYSQECNGCIYKDNCIEAGTQKIINNDLFYCGKDLELRNAKFYGYGCQENYECISFYCKENKCDDLNYGKEFEEYSRFSRINNAAKELIKFIPIGLLLVIVIFIIALLFSAIRKKGKKAKKGKNGGKKIIYLDYAKHAKKKYEKLEGDIEKSFKRVKKEIK